MHAVTDSVAAVAELLFGFDVCYHAAVMEVCFDQLAN